ncbi:MAG: polysaccharide deacetylase family protein [Faecousia sp.]
MKKMCLILSAVLLMQSLLMGGCAVNRMQDEASTESTILTDSLENTGSEPTNPTASGPLSSESTHPAETEPAVSETEDTQPVETLPAETEPPVTEPPVTQPPETEPPETEPPVTEPPATEPVNSDEYIGSLYTRGQLLQMDNTLSQYGPGSSYGGFRPGGAVRAQNSLGQYDAFFVAEDTNVIYLTFDCGYEYNNLTASILDTLKQKDVKAVFFVTMHYVQSNPQLVQRMIDEGHIVGNHSNNHISMPTLSIDEMAYQIQSLSDYVQAKFGYEMHLFRPPKGEYSVRALALAQSLGYSTVQWSFAYADWSTDNQPQPADALELITGSAHNGAIFLLHAVSETNAAILGDVIDNLRSQGYSLELFGA